MLDNLVTPIECDPALNMNTESIKNHNTEPLSQNQRITEVGRDLQDQPNLIFLFVCKVNSTFSRQSDQFSLFSFLEKLQLSHGE